jgi:mRNA interferase HigB
MTVYGETFLVEFAKKHAAARKPIARFLTLIKGAAWQNSEELKQTFPSADYAPGTRTVIFNIGGNKYRILSRVDFEEQAIRILSALTHEKYGREQL